MPRQPRHTSDSSGSPPPACDFRCDGCGVWRAWRDLDEHGGARICCFCVKRRNEILLGRTQFESPHETEDGRSCAHAEGPNIKIDWAAREIAIYGGRTRRPERDPIRIPFRSCRSLLHVIAELLRIADAGWFTGSSWARAVAALMQVYMAESGVV